MLPGAVVADAAGRLPDRQRRLDSQALAPGRGVLQCIMVPNDSSQSSLCRCDWQTADVGTSRWLLISCVRQETPRLTFRAPSTHAEVNDVRWHPTQPGVFAAVLGNGRAELWDVCRSVLEPVAVFVRDGRPACAALYTFLRSLATKTSQSAESHLSSSADHRHCLQVPPLHAPPSLAASAARCWRSLATTARSPCWRSQACRNLATALGRCTLLWGLRNLRRTSEDKRVMQSRSLSLLDFMWA